MVPFTSNLILVDKIWKDWSLEKETDRQTDKNRSIHLKGGISYIVIFPRKWSRETAFSRYSNRASAECAAIPEGAPRYRYARCTFAEVRTTRLSSGHLENN
jgi:hypothetical protein